MIEGYDPVPCCFVLGLLDSLTIVLPPASQKHIAEAFSLFHLSIVCSIAQFWAQVSKRLPSASGSGVSFKNELDFTACSPIFILSPAKQEWKGTMRLCDMSHRIVGDK
jgi:hypothetical protein